eukprot:GFUD01121044.1.p1 GENE.GFUD01121044.1~~GFUD01121044.1.p1  ORF type:complete len:203 (+),score=67.15 GFUD01121044.1:59-667(+)
MTEPRDDSTVASSSSSTDPARFMFDMYDRALKATKLVTPSSKNAIHPYLVANYKLAKMNAEDVRALEFGWFEGPGMPKSRADILRRLPAYNRQNRCSLVGRPVSGRHRKNCTECDQSFYNDGEEWYWTDAMVPWGADKYCDRCVSKEVGMDFEKDEEVSDEEDDSEEVVEGTAVEGNGPGVDKKSKEEYDTNSGQKRRKLGD